MHGLDGYDQAALVRSGELRPDELVSAAVRRAEELDPRLGFLVSERYEQAVAESRHAADLQGRPFAGVPIVMKDLHCHFAGDPIAYGCRGLRDAGLRATFTTHLANRLAAAGFITLGRSTTSEFGLLPTTEARAGRITRNPWDPSRSAGGSSGGSAAAVAAGVVPVAHGNDGGGSLRIPAAACGVVGLKPTRGRTSLGPRLSEAPGGVLCEHVLTRSVRDSGLVLDAVAGPMPGDPYTAVSGAGGWHAAATRASVAGLRVGVATQLPGGKAVAEDTGAAVLDAAALLEEQGAAVEESFPEALGADDWRPWQLVLYAARAAHTVRTAGTLRGHPLREDEVEDFTWALSRIGEDTSAVSLIDALQLLGTWTRRLARWWADPDGYDVLLCPVLPGPPPLLGTIAPPGADPWAVLQSAAELSRFTGFCNVSGQPAISVPIGHDRSGLPTSVQFVAAHGREDLLLSAAAAVQRQRPVLSPARPIARSAQVE